MGEENMFIFGLTVEEVEDLKPKYNASDFVDKNPELQQVNKLKHVGGPEVSCLFTFRTGHESAEGWHLLQDRKQG